MYSHDDKISNAKKIIIIITRWNDTNENENWLSDYRRIEKPFFAAIYLLL